MQAVVNRNVHWSLQEINCTTSTMYIFQAKINSTKIFSISAEEMLQTKDYFKNGQLDKDGLVKFIKDVKKNTKLSDEDAAVLAASK